MSAIRRSIVIMCLCFFSFGSQGCAVPAVAVSAGIAAAQAGTGTYRAGELRAGRFVTMDEAWHAVERAIDDLEIEPETTVVRDRRRYVMAREPGGPRFRITVERKSRTATRIRIRVGFIGDAALSRLTMRRIDHHLAEIAPRTNVDHVRDE